jgi:hypothetical protein
LKLDLVSLEVKHPRVLLQYPGEELVGRFRSLAPEHVETDHAATFDLCLGLAERGSYQLVLLDAAVLEGEVAAAAAQVRERQPEAGILALSSQAGPADRRKLEGALDGCLRVPFDEDLVHDFLYVQYLRPLVFPVGVALCVAGFRGAAEDLDVYFAQLARVLACRAKSGSELAGEITVDLTRAPADAERLARLACTVYERLALAGAATAFRVPEEARAGLQACSALGRAVLLENAP